MIPQAIRKWAELRAGDEVVFRAQTDGSIRIERYAAQASPFARFRGAWRDTEITMQQIRAMRSPEMETPAKDAQS